MNNKLKSFTYGNHSELHFYVRRQQSNPVPEPEFISFLYDVKELIADPTNQDIERVKQREIDNLFVYQLQFGYYRYWIEYI